MSRHLFIHRRRETLRTSPVIFPAIIQVVLAMLQSQETTSYDTSSVAPSYDLQSRRVKSPKLAPRVFFRSRIFLFFKLYLVLEDWQEDPIFLLPGFFVLRYSWKLSLSSTPVILRHSLIQHIPSLVRPFSLIAALLHLSHLETPNSH